MRCLINYWKDTIEIRLLDISSNILFAFGKACEHYVKMERREGSVLNIEQYISYLYFWHALGDTIFFWGYFIYCFFSHTINHQDIFYHHLYLICVCMALSTFYFKMGLWCQTKMVAIKSTYIFHSQTGSQHNIWGLFQEPGSVTKQVQLTFLNHIKSGTIYMTIDPIFDYCMTIGHNVTP